MTRYTPWRGNDQAVETAIARARSRQARAAGPDDYNPPTGETWGLVRVSRGELTCLACGETFGAPTSNVSEAEAFCWRCGGAVGVPTESYLQEDEYTYAS